MTPINFTDLVTDRRLLGPFFRGRSWARWKAVGKAIFCEPMTARDVALFREVADRAPPERPVSEVVIIAGRGAGKDSFASAVAIEIALGDYLGRLRPGERGILVIIAVDREQAAIAQRYIRAAFEECAALRPMVVTAGEDFVELENRVVIEVHANSYRSVRGRSIIAAIFDEVGHWRGETSSSPDTQVYGAVRPGLARMPGSKLIMISTAHKRAGLLYQRWRDHYGREDDYVLVVRGTTLQFNPTFDAGVIEKDLERDAQLFGAEYNSVWRDDLQTFLSRDLIDAAVDRGLLVRPPRAGIRYVCGADPSGGRGDSFCAAISHREGDVAFLDTLYERRAPFNPSSAVAEVVALAKSYRCGEVVGDKYAAQWVVEAFAKAGVRYVQSDRDRSACYLNCLPLFASGRVRLVDNARLAGQFAALERRTFSTGRDRVDHGRDGHDDAANAAALALTLAAVGVKEPIRIPAAAKRLVSTPGIWGRRMPLW